MSLLFTVKRTALLPTYVLTLSSTATFDLSQATGVVLAYRLKGTTARHTIALAVTDAPNKKVTLTPDAALVATLGDYECQIEVTFPTGTMMFPEDDFDEFKVTATLE